MTIHPRAEDVSRVNLVSRSLAQVLPGQMLNGQLCVGKDARYTYLLRSNGVWRHLNEHVRHNHEEHERHIQADRSTRS